MGVVTVGWLALTQTVLFYGATFWGIAHAGAGLAAVLANTDALFVAVLAALVLGERLWAVQWLGLIVGLAGAAVVVWEGPLWPPALSGGAAVVVGGAIAWSVGTVVVARGVRATADPLALAGWQMLVGGIVLCAAGVVAEGLPDRAGARELGLVVALAVVGLGDPVRALLPRPHPGSRRRGLGVVLPRTGDRRGHGLAVARRAADRAAARRHGRGLPRPLAGDGGPPRPARGGVGRLDGAAVSIPPPARAT